MRPLGFEEYLSEQFWKQYQGLDDESPDAESEWITDLSPDEWIDYAEAWSAKRVIMELTKE